MLIAVFQNIRAVIRAEHLCCDHGLKVTVMPLPETLSSECGMCLSFDGNREQFEQIMQQASILVKIYDKI